MIRKTFFWIHLGSGLVAGLVIFVMSFTGVLLTFQPQMLEWKRRDLQNLKPPAAMVAEAASAGAGEEQVRRMKIEELVARVNEQLPEGKPTGITLPSNPNAAVAVRYGRAPAVYLNPWTGDVIEDPAARWDSFFRSTTAWHRWLAAEGENRKIARAITGAFNTVFLVLALTGIYLWMPRRWLWQTIRPVLWFRKGLKAKARDFNWHHVMGFWTLPAVVVITASGMVISYTWAADLVYRIHGEEPIRGRPGPARVAIEAPEAEASPLPLDDLLSKVSQAEAATGIKTITVPLAGPRGKEPLALNLSLKEEKPWPPFASIASAVNPYTGEVVQRSTFADQSPGRRMRGWLRYLHTGEALGWPGQLAAGIASLAGVFLVYTGTALSLRRFSQWRRRRARVAKAKALAAGRRKKQDGEPTEEPQVQNPPSDRPKIPQNSEELVAERETESAGAQESSQNAKNEPESGAA